MPLPETPDENIEWCRQIRQYLGLQVTEEERSPQGDFSLHVTVLRRRMLDVCKGGLCQHTDFDEVFDPIRELWEAQKFEPKDSAKAFEDAEQALDEAENNLAEHLQELAARAQRRLDFTERLQGFRERVKVVVDGLAATQEDFAAAFLELQRVASAEDIDQEEATTAFGVLQGLIEKAEIKVEAAKLYALTLKDTQDRRNLLATNKLLPPDALDKANTGIQEAEVLAGTQQYTEATQHLTTTVKKALDRVQKLAEEEQEIADNRDQLLSDVWSRNLKDHRVPAEQLEEILSEEQISELVRMERSTQLIKNDKKRKEARRDIRDRYFTFKEEYDLANIVEEEEEVPEVETAQARLERIDKRKTQYKSTISLFELDDEGEIFATREVFSNRGSAQDWTVGYDIFLKNGPAPKRKQYRKMIIHFHFSDRTLARIERAHFKTAHAASDKSHVIIKPSNEARALSICKKYL